ncbi:hypothetical protein G3T14_18590 [Methylobacterium sp. BTF04]|nr:hypothetical protein [Methylobacterium sp. BTF04]NEU14122.1 hypothetical protein [Methylobacterium sp. BTF04]
MTQSADANAAESVKVTFRGRGLAMMRGRKVELLVCPMCSQRTVGKVAQKGMCNWCAYEPSCGDAEPILGA